MDFQQFLTKFQKAEVEEYQNDVPKDVLVSVCVQTYRHAPYIRNCLDGILMQEADFDFELLLGEDESDDGTREICLEYAERYPERIRLFLHSRKNNIFKHGAPSSTFNLLYNLFSTRGKFIALCEGDDFWIDKKKLFTQAGILGSNDEIGLSFHRVRIDRLGGSILSPVHPQLIEFEDLVRQRLAYTPSMVFRREGFEDLPEWFTEIPYLDYSIALLATQDRRAHFSPEVMAAYRVHSGGMSSGSDPIKSNALSKLALETCRNHFAPRAANEFSFRRTYLEVDLCFKLFDMRDLNGLREAYAEAARNKHRIPFRAKMALFIRLAVARSVPAFKFFRWIRKWLRRSGA